MFTTATVEAAKEFLGEGFQSTKPIMPPMPLGDPWPNIGVLLGAEDHLRNNKSYDREAIDKGEPYWRDLIRLLHVFRCKKAKDVETIKTLRKGISSDTYLPFVDKMLN